MIIKKIITRIRKMMFLWNQIKPQVVKQKVKKAQI